MALTAPMNSSRSEGFRTRRGYHAVYHRFDDCHYAIRIINNRHTQPGIGIDDLGNPRDLCIHCERLWARRYGPLP